jgi:plasmid stabilization system protein ParE
MRTTVTLDSDLAAKLRVLARERGISIKEALNSTLRRGLASGGDFPRRYRLASRRLGLRRRVDLEHALRLAGELEDAETIRKLELRK